MIQNLFISVKSLRWSIFVPVLAFLAPIVPLVLTVGIFIIADTIFGIAKIIKQKGWKGYTSKGLSSIVSKMVLYSSCVLLTFCLEKFLLDEFIHILTEIPYFLTKLVAILLCYIEVKSILENFEAITGVNLWSAFKGMLSRAKNIKKEIEDLKN